MEYTINTAFLPMLNQKLATFKKKFKKYGDGALIFSVGEEFIDEKTREKMVRVSIEGSYKVCDYQFIATLEWDDKTQSNIIRKMSSDIEVPYIYRTRTECDHCKTKRFRKNTVLLRKADGEYVQVGKGCLHDYIGVDIESYAGYLSWWENTDEFIEENTHIAGVRPNIVFTVDEVIGQTWEYVARRGYISKQQSYDYECDSTSSMVWDAVMGIKDFYGNLLYEKYSITEDSMKKTAEVKEFINNYDDSDNDYAHNLKVLLAHKYVECANVGMAVSAVGFFLRETKKSEERAKKVPSEWFANVGDRIEFTATPVCITSYDTEFGVTYIYKMMKGDNIIIWKTSKPLDEVEVTIKATVKENSQYRGEKQTIITRGKVSA